MATVTFSEKNLARVEWKTDEGETVIGVFELVGWVKAPSAAIQDVINRQKNAPVTVVHPRRKTSNR